MKIEMLKTEMHLKVAELSEKYSVRKLTENDIENVYQLAIGNPQYYKHCPPVVTRESVWDDMNALPPGMTKNEKYYVGYFQENKLIAIMDLIVQYPNEQTSFVGLFMMAKEYQGKGIGSAIIEELGNFLKDNGYCYIRLAFVKDNPQSKAFWHKNKFVPTGVESIQERYTLVIMQKSLI